MEAGGVLELQAQAGLRNRGHGNLESEGLESGGLEDWGWRSGTPGSGLERGSL